MSEPLSIVLTDSPEVVRLKREFYGLCQREEQLRPFIRHAPAVEEIMRVRQRKSAIGTAIFAATYSANSTAP